MNKVLTIALFMLLLLHPFQSEARDNPFISKKAPAKEVRLPTIASKVFAKIMLWQHQLNNELTRLVKRLKTEKS